MVMTINREELQVAIADGDELLCSTNSRNRFVQLFLRGGEFIVFNSQQEVARVSDIDQAVERFNHYASRSLNQQEIS